MTGDESTDISFGAETTNIPRTSFTTRPWKSCPISSTRSRWCGSSTTRPPMATWLSAASTHLAWPRGVWIIGLESWENWDCTCTARARIGLFWVRYVERQSSHPEETWENFRKTNFSPSEIDLNNKFSFRRYSFKTTRTRVDHWIRKRHESHCESPRRWFRILQRLPQIVIQRWM